MSTAVAESASAPVMETRLPRETARPRAFTMDVEVAADADALGTIRQAVGGLAVALGADAAASADVRLALTEVCSNAIKRSEPPEALRVHVELFGADVLRVTVRDDAAPAGMDSAFPLPLIAALTETLELRRSDLGGSEVAMTFALRS